MQRIHTVGHMRKVLGDLPDNAEMLFCFGWDMRRPKHNGHFWGSAIMIDESKVDNDGFNQDAITGLVVWVKGDKRPTTGQESPLSKG